MRSLSFVRCASVLSHPSAVYVLETNLEYLGTDSVLFLLFSLTFIATVLYLPQHLQFIISRAWFYMHGDSYEPAAGLAKGVLNSVVGTAAAATAETVREL